MPTSYLHYGLQSGYVYNWLAAGPMALPVSDPQGHQNADLVRQILQAHASPDFGVTVKPVERGSLEEGVFKIGAYHGAWSYYACQEDHFVDHSGHYPDLQYLCSWASAHLVSKEPRQVSLVLTSFGKASLWLNGTRLGEQESGARLLHSQAYPGFLNPGGNQIMVRFETVAYGNTSHAVALQVLQPLGGKKTAPLIPSRDIRVTAISSVPRTRFSCAGRTIGKSPMMPIYA
jgi:hypothetical protein